jgi:hypothetical protein
MDRVKPETTPSAVPLLSQPVWLSLTPSVRAKLVQLFGLKRSGATETYMGRDSVVRVVSDGYTAADLLAVTTQRMQELLGTDSKDFYGLFDDVLANIDALLNGSFLAEFGALEDLPKDEIPEVPVKRGRKKVIKN